MSDTDRSPALRAVALGAATGLRSMMSPALLSRAASSGELAELERTRLAFLRDRRVSALLGVAALGELVADKIPGVGARTETGPLLGRLAAGGVVGYALFAASGNDGKAGLVLGGLSAVASAHAGHSLRREISRGFDVPDLLCALVEDAVALSAGLLALSNIR